MDGDEWGQPTTPKAFMLGGGAGSSLVDHHTLAAAAALDLQEEEVNERKEREERENEERRQRRRQRRQARLAAAKAAGAAVLDIQDGGSSDSSSGMSDMEEIEKDLHEARKAFEAASASSRSIGSSAVVPQVASDDHKRPRSDSSLRKQSKSGASIRRLHPAVVTAREELYALLGSEHRGSARHACITKLLLYSYGHTWRHDFLDQMDLRVLPHFCVLLEHNVNRVQKTVRLRYCKIGDRGACRLAAALLLNKTLQGMLLADPTISNRGWGALAMQMVASKLDQRCSLVGGDSPIPVGLTKVTQVICDCTHDVNIRAPPTFQRRLSASFSPLAQQEQNGQPQLWKRAFPNGDTFVMSTASMLDSARISHNGAIRADGFMTMDRYREVLSREQLWIVMTMAILSLLVTTVATASFFADFSVGRAQPILVGQAACVLLGQFYSMWMLYRAGRSAAAIIFQLLPLTVIFDATSAIFPVERGRRVTLDVMDSDSITSVMLGRECVFRLITSQVSLQAAPLAVIHGFVWLTASSRDNWLWVHAVGFTLCLLLCAMLLSVQDVRAVEASGRSRLHPPRKVRVPFWKQGTATGGSILGDGLVLTVCRVIEVIGRLSLLSVSMSVLGNNGIVIHGAGLVATYLYIDGCRCRPAASMLATVGQAFWGFPGMGVAAPMFVVRGKHSIGREWPRWLMFCCVGPIFLIILACFRCNEDWEQMHWDAPSDTAFQSHLPDRFYFLCRGIEEVVVLAWLFTVGIPVEVGGSWLLILMCLLVVLKLVVAAPLQAYIIAQIPDRGYYKSAPRLVKHASEAAAMALYIGKVRSKLKAARMRIADKNPHAQRSPKVSPTSSDRVDAKSAPGSDPSRRSSATTPKLADVLKPDSPSMWVVKSSGMTGKSKSAQDIHAMDVPTDEFDAAPGRRRSVL